MGGRQEQCTGLETFVTVFMVVTVRLAVGGKRSVRGFSRH